MVVVGSREASKAAAFIERNKLVHASPVAGYDAVLDFPGVEAVYIPLPTALHVEWVQKAASKGLHIVLEKPIAIEDEHVDAIVKAAADANVVLFDGTMWMHHPRTAAMEAALQEIGPVWDVDSAFTFKGERGCTGVGMTQCADGMLCAASREHWQLTVRLLSLRLQRVFLSNLLHHPCRER